MIMTCSHTHTQHVRLQKLQSHPVSPPLYPVRATARGRAEIKGSVSHALPSESATQIKIQTSAEKIMAENGDIAAANLPIIWMLGDFFFG